MVMATSTIVIGYIGLKYLGLEIYDQISIPQVGRAYQEQEFIQKGIIGLSFRDNTGKVTHQLCKNQGLLGSGLGKFEIKFL